MNFWLVLSEPCGRSTSFKPSMVHQAGFTTSVTAKSVLFCFCICGAVVLTAWTLTPRAAMTTPATLSGTTRQQIVSSFRKGVCEQILLPLDTRGKLATFLESEKARVGVEIGVHAGHFAETILHQWKHNVKYYLIDVWAPLTNYLDSANVGKPLIITTALLKHCCSRCAKLGRLIRCVW